MRRFKDKLFLLIRACTETDLVMENRSSESSESQQAATSASVVVERAWANRLLESASDFCLVVADELFSVFSCLGLKEKNIFLI